MSYFTEHKNGLIGTAVVHAVILFLLLNFGFFTKLPLPAEEGILVNFGNSETGLGIEEPAPGELSSSNDQENAKAEEQVTMPPVPKKIAPAAPKEEIVTQDLEKTIAIKTTKKKAPEKKVDPEKQQQLEADRLQKAEFARQKREEEQRLAQVAAEQKKIGEINSRAKSAFGGGGRGAADSKSTSQGITYGSGNQGSPNGSANVDRYGPGGGIGNGISFSLDGRTAQLLPKPHYPGNEEGVVIVQVTVDKNGLVKKAEAGVRGSNTANTELIAAAKKAALQARFNVDQNAPAFQTGTITYRFVLD